MTRLRAALAGLLLAVLVPAGAAHAATSHDGQEVSFTPDQGVYPMDPGTWTTVSMTLTTSDNRPLAAPASLGYRGTTLLFAAGTASGTTTPIPVAAPAATGPATAVALPFDLQAPGARLTTPEIVVNAHGLPYLDPAQPVGRRVDDLLGRMTLADKIGQMTQAERGAVTGDPALVAGLRLGSLYSSPGSAPAPDTPAGWATMIDKFQQYARSTPLQIPLLYGVDAGHGFGALPGATILPDHVGLGAARDPDLTTRASRVTADELRAVGVTWNLAPDTSVARDERTGSAYQSFGEDPALVSRMAAAAAAGLPGSGVLPAGTLTIGSDVFRGPTGPAPFEQRLTGSVVAGRTPVGRIDQAVRRILQAKFELGLFEQPYAPPAAAAQIGTAAHRAVARQAVAESQVLLKNAGHLLPLPADANLYVAGRSADDVGNQSGGWPLDGPGRAGASGPGTSILQGIREVAPQAKVTFSPDASAPTAGADVGVVVVGETPDAESPGDAGAPDCTWCAPPRNEARSLTLQPGDRAVVDRVCAALPTCVVLVLSGRPQVVPVASITALVASWLPGSEGAGVADVLFGRVPFTGRLPVTWPASANQEPINAGDKTYQPQFPYSWGLRTDPERSRLVTLPPSPALAALLAPANWDASGALRVSPATLRLASAALGSPGASDAVLSVLRDAAEARGGRSAAAAIARADQSGSPAGAFACLRAVL